MPWYVQGSTKIAGPFEDAKMRALIKQGKINASTLVRDAEEPDWRRVDETEFFTATSTARPKTRIPLGWMAAAFAVAMLLCIGGIVGRVIYLENQKASSKATPTDKTVATIDGKPLAAPHGKKRTHVDLGPTHKARKNYSELDDETEYRFPPVVMFPAKEDYRNKEIWTSVKVASKGTAVVSVSFFGYEDGFKRLKIKLDGKVVFDDKGSGSGVTMPLRDARELANADRVLIGIGGSEFVLPAVGHAAIQAAVDQADQHLEATNK